MPRYVPPGSDEQRLMFMQQALAKGTQDLADGKEYLSQSTLDDLTALAGSFETAFAAINDRQSARSQATRVRSQAVETLSTYVRDVWEGVRRRQRRLDEPAEVLQFYGLPLDGTSPNPTQQQEWLAYAQTIVDGDADAVAAGYAAICNPTAVAVQGALDTAQAAVDAAANADTALDDVQAALADLRTQADDLIEHVVAELRFGLHQLEPPSQRRIMRTYGAVFAYEEGEEPDPDDVI